MIAYLEVHSLVIDLRAGKHVEREWATCVLLNFVVPLESAEANLKSNELFAHELHFLVPLFYVIVVISFVFKRCSVSYQVVNESPYLKTRCQLR